MKKNILKVLSKFPKIKKIVKDIYQFIGFILSDKKTYPTTIRQISSNNNDHLFGYYDKSPWSNDGKYLIYQRVYDAHKITASTQKSEIIIYDIQLGDEQILSYTNSWNVQQGSMLQWLGPNFNKKIIYNDYIENKYCSVILDVISRERIVIDYPVYSVSKTGKFALTLDFNRLNSLRPGYGYSNSVDISKNIKLPNETAVWRVDLENNEKVPLVSYSQLISQKHKQSMNDAFHKVNHIMISPDSLNFIFLHRWINNGKKYDRLILFDLITNNMEILMDDDMVSHCNWLNNNRIITWANDKKRGNHYYIIDVLDKSIEIFMDQYLKADGHPSISPDGNYLITDTYPDFLRKQKLYLCKLNEEKCFEIASIYSSYKFKNNQRCDLHPRWNPNSDQICFDGSQNKKRQVFIIDIKEDEKDA